MTEGRTDGVDEALGREEGDAVARRALVSLVVREGDGAGSGHISPAARGVCRRSEGDSRLPCYGESAVRCLDYGAAIYGREDALALLTVRDFLFVLSCFLRHRSRRVYCVTAAVRINSFPAERCGRRAGAGAYIHLCGRSAARRWRKSANNRENNCAELAV